MLRSGSANDDHRGSDNHNARSDDSTADNHVDDINHDVHQHHNNGCSHNFGSDDDHLRSAIHDNVCAADVYDHDDFRFYNDRESDVDHHIDIDKQYDDVDDNQQHDHIVHDDNHTSTDHHHLQSAAPTADDDYAGSDHVFFQHDGWSGKHDIHVDEYFDVNLEHDLQYDDVDKFHDDIDDHQLDHNHHACSDDNRGSDHNGRAHNNRRAIDDDHQSTAGDNDDVSTDDVIDHCRSGKYVQLEFHIDVQHEHVVYNVQHQYQHCIDDQQHDDIQHDHQFHDNNAGTDHHGRAGHDHAGG